MHYKWSIGYQKIAKSADYRCNFQLFVITEPRKKWGVRLIDRMQYKCNFLVYFIYLFLFYFTYLYIKINEHYGSTF